MTRTKYRNLIIILTYYGEWVNRGIPELDYPSQSTAFSDRNMDKHYSPPSWWKNTPKVIKSIVRHLHVRRSSTKPEVRGKTPGYMPHHGYSQMHVQIEQLPQHLKQVIKLKYVHGLTTAETATKMNLSIGQVKRLSTKAYKTLFENIDFCRPK
jgi:predicted DNA-binding protein (UPF0251 family)